MGQCVLNVRYVTAIAAATAGAIVGVALPIVTHLIIILMPLMVILTMPDKS